MERKFFWVFLLHGCTAQLTTFVGAAAARSYRYGERAAWLMISLFMREMRFEPKYFKPQPLEPPCLVEAGSGGYAGEPAARKAQSDGRNEAEYPETADRKSRRNCAPDRT
jgi:hypothetical protein